jgi:hypothetical protein
VLQELIDQERGISYGVVQRGREVDRGVPVVRISNFVGNRFFVGHSRASLENLSPSHPRACASLADTATTWPNARSNGHDSLAIPSHSPAKMADAQAHGANT